MGPHRGLGLLPQRALYADPVEITGANTQLGSSDGDIFDWTHPYHTRQVFSAIQ